MRSHAPAPHRPLISLARLGRWVPALALVAGVATVVPGSEAASSGTLAVSPAQASPGETLTLTGSLPTKIRRPVAVQRGMYGKYSDVARSRTDASGHFSFRIPKNGMPSDPYRVVAKKVRIHHHVYPAISTPIRVVKTQEPDVLVSLSADSVGIGDAATLTATGTPVRPGRPLTLQLRTSPTTWQTIGASVPENARGQATFTLPTSAAGTEVFRVRAETWNGAGWYPSFPVTLSVGTDTSARTAAGSAWRAQVDAARKTAAAQPGQINAANTFKWGPIAEAWEWETGQSTDPWQIYSDGTGRATVYTAMLALDSGQWGGGRAISTGTVMATLQNSGHTYGRWEARVRGPIFAGGKTDYTMGLRLVPVASTYALCPGAGVDRSVDLGTWTGYGSSTTIGVRKGSTDWTTTRSLARNRDNWHTLAVEVTPKRIVWFLDAKVTAVLNNPAAVPGVPLVPQFVLQGKPGAGMKHTKLTADWLRYFTLARKDKGKVKAAAPTATTIAPTC